MKKYVLSITAALAFSPGVYAADLSVSSEFFGLAYNESAIFIENSKIRQSAIVGDVEAECDGFNSACSNHIASISAAGNVTIRNADIDQSVIAGDVAARCTGINCTAKNVLGSIQAGR